MKNFILIVSSIFLLACTSQKEVSSIGAGASNSSQIKEKKKGRKIYGVVAKMYLKEVIKGKGLKTVEKPRLSFQVDNEYYFIKISSSKVTEEKLKSLTGKKIGVRGKLIGEGFGGEALTGIISKKEGSLGGAKGNDIGEILIYEILEIEK